MRFVRYPVAFPGFRFLWNTYPHVGRENRKIIGACLVVGRHAYSLQWKKP